ncbi:hypothetical protein ACFW24_33890, partial [Streptomyces nigra]|uniref:hypothetical protein n=1 Tax=Streptomyces nigra TaxID=1827580 RepID=UPI0036B07143
PGHRTAEDPPDVRRARSRSRSRQAAARALIAGVLDSAPASGASCSTSALLAAAEGGHHDVRDLTREQFETVLATAGFHVGRVLPMG